MAYRTHFWNGLQKKSVFAHFSVTNQVRLCPATCSGVAHGLLCFCRFLIYPLPRLCTPAFATMSFSKLLVKSYVEAQNLGCLSEWKTLALDLACPDAATEVSSPAASVGFASPPMLQSPDARRHSLFSDSPASSLGAAAAAHFPAAPVSTPSAASASAASASASAASASASAVSAVAFTYESAKRAAKSVKVPGLDGQLANKKECPICPGAKLLTNTNFARHLKEVHRLSDDAPMPVAAPPPASDSDHDDELRDPTWTEDLDVRPPLKASPARSAAQTAAPAIAAMLSNAPSDDDDDDDDDGAGDAPPKGQQLTQDLPCHFGMKQPGKPDNLPPIFQAFVDWRVMGNLSQTQARIDVTRVSKMICLMGKADGLSPAESLTSLNRIVVSMRLLSDALAALTKLGLSSNHQYTNAVRWFLQFLAVSTDDKDKALEFTTAETRVKQMTITQSKNYRKNATRANTREKLEDEGAWLDMTELRDGAYQTVLPQLREVVKKAKRGVQLTPTELKTATLACMLFVHVESTAVRGGELPSLLFDKVMVELDKTPLGTIVVTDFKTQASYGHKAIALTKNLRNILQAYAQYIRPQAVQRRAAGQPESKVFFVSCSGGPMAKYGTSLANYVGEVLNLPNARITPTMIRKIEATFGAENAIANPALASSMQRNRAHSSMVSQNAYTKVTAVAVAKTAVELRQAALNTTNTFGSLMESSDNDDGNDDDDDKDGDIIDERSGPASAAAAAAAVPSSVSALAAGPEDANDDGEQSADDGELLSPDVNAEEEPVQPPRKKMKKM